MFFYVCLLFELPIMYCLIKGHKSAIFLNKTVAAEYKTREIKIFVEQKKTLTNNTKKLEVGT